MELNNLSFVVFLVTLIHVALLTHFLEEVPQRELEGHFHPLVCTQLLCNESVVRVVSRLCSSATQEYLWYLLFLRSLQPQLQQPEMGILEVTCRHDSNENRATNGSVHSILLSEFQEICFLGIDMISQFVAKGIQ